MNTIIQETPASTAVPKKPASQPAYFSVWDLHAYYGESYIVQGVSFNVHEGEILALLGRNGAGKTSTLRAIARLDDPQITHGEVWLDHQHIHSMKSHEAAQAGIQLVPKTAASSLVSRSRKTSNWRRSSNPSAGRWIASMTCSPAWANAANKKA